MRKTVLLAHVFFDILGGGEYLALNIVKALRDSGYDVVLFTCTPIDIDAVRKLFGINIGDCRVVARNVPVTDLLRRVGRGRFVRLRRLMAYWKLFTEYLKDFEEDYDLIMETQSNIMSPVDISYIHYPAIVDYYRGEREGVMWSLYNWLVRRYAEKFKHGMIAGRVLTNSSWTASVIYKVYHVVANVVYPPVDVEYFNRVADNDKREKLVITISRFTGEKRLDKIVDVASRLRDYTFVLIGSTYEYSDKVLELINEKIRENRLDNVIIETNVPRHEMLRYMRDSRYYLHPEFAEHFGISVVEAMASGLVPIVYRDGGAWHDVVSRVNDILGYTAISEVPDIIRRLDSNKKLYEELRSKSIEVSRLFNYNSFKKNILKEIEYVLRIKELGKSNS